MQINELKKLSIPDLNQELLNLQQKHFDLRMQRTSGQINHPHRMREIKRGIAQIKTILTQKSKVGN